MSNDSPLQFGTIVNALFACQKLKIAVDTLAMDFSDQQKVNNRVVENLDKTSESKVFEDKNKSYLLQQGAQLTGGIFTRVLYQSDVFAQLVMSGFLSSQSIRPSLKLPATIEMAMCSFCVCCGLSQGTGHACSYCLSFHCSKEKVKCRVCQRLFA